MPLSKSQKQSIIEQFKLTYGLKQCIEDGREDAIKKLSKSSGLKFDFLKQNIQTLKQIQWQ